ncbi:hypothetical protein LCGC14_2990530 [marine sediment metagenome]|uniref:Phosphotyrosine protein phosphatase I domain-containing protein n=1 Tax=marine sediment metagenome TaxID=412755 RepID=A0A0F8X3W5_9ZZZZ
MFPEAKNMILKSFSDPAETNGTHEQIMTVFKNMRDLFKEWLISYLKTL